jgi:aryl-alcohol dehydrogenase-like predicted oxidoreductase
MKLALGTVQFGLPYGIANRIGQVHWEDAKGILDFARTNQINVLDTAIAYGNSESCLGAIGTSGFDIVTKLPAVPECVQNIDGWMRCQIQTSLQRLRVPSIYGLLLHRPQQLMSTSGKIIAKTLEQMKHDGVVQKIGVSIYSPSDLDEVTQACEIDLVQAPFSLVDQRLRSSGWLARLHRSGVEIHTRSAFMQGLLLMPRSEIPSKFKRWDCLWDKWQDWLNTNHVTAVKACLDFVMSFPEIDRVVVGVDCLEQLEQQIAAACSDRSQSLPNLTCDDERLINPANWN